APVEVDERFVLLLAGDAPRVPEVHDHDLAGEVARPDAGAVERREVVGGCGLPEEGALVCVGARGGPHLGGAGDGERHHDGAGGERDPARPVLHTVTFSRSGAGGAAGTGSSTGLARRRSDGDSAMSVPTAITPPPTHSQRTIGLRATPMVTRPCSFGDETSVRYTSSRRPPRTDGLPLARDPVRDLEIAGA